MVRAAVSVLSNITEGFESQTQGAFNESLSRANASCDSVESQLSLALDRKYLTAAEYKRALRLAETCSKQLIKSISGM